MRQVCYYAIPRQESGDPSVRDLSVDDIDPFLCTHIVVAFAAIVKNEIVPQDEKDTQVYKEVIALKKKNPKLKVLLSLGGSSPNPGYSDLVRDPVAVSLFSSKAREFLLSYGFDGLDLDWEFPAWPVLRSDYRERRWFTQLVRQLDHDFKLMSPTPLLLSIAVAAPKTIIDVSYEVDQLAEFVDFVSLMSYDYHIFWAYLPFTGYNSPLAKRRTEKCYFATLNIQWSADYWLRKGMPKEKLVIGVPTYGRSWKLIRGSWCSVGSPAIGEGISRGTLSYPEAYFFVQEGAKYFFDEESRVPYAVRGRDWVSYDDAKSIKEKTQWIKDSGFAGVMTWNLNCDDWAGVCSGKKFKLHNIIKDILFESEPVESTD